MNFMLKDENAIYYECGYSCDNALYLSLGSEAYFITDGRYTIEASTLVQNAKVVITHHLTEKALEILNQSSVKKVYFDPKEWRYAEMIKMKEEGRCQFVEKENLSHLKRIIKREDEILFLEKAVQKGKKAFKAFAHFLEEKGEGYDEYTLTHFAKSYLSYEGKYALSFDPIVAIGQNAAKPHALPTKRRLKKGDLLLFDAGLKYKRYCSDRTRTLFFEKGSRFSKQQHFSKKKIQKAYDTVLKAHDRAIAGARSGMKAYQVDALSRHIIDKAGFGAYFVHSTGHGVGLDIHEMPYISQRSQTKIEDGMVFTIEPGIYLPETFGIRIEDMVVMVDGKAKVLS